LPEAFISERIVTPAGERAGAVLVRDGKIAGICDHKAIPPGYQPVPCAGALLPGLVDSHIHINEPGRTEWEGFATATRAAASGGYTTLIDMPLNCLPATTTVAALEAKRAAALGQCWVDWGAWGGVSENNAADLEPLAAGGVRGFKCFLAEPGIDGFARVDEAELRRALPFLTRTGLPLLVHAELPEELDRAARGLANADWHSHTTWLHSRPDEAEVAAIRLMIGLAKEYGVRLHIVHLVSAHALEILREAQAAGVTVTVETCPHYLYFAAPEIADGATIYKCAPPIRSLENRELLWQALRRGEIDLVATDHSPCPPEWKERGNGSFAEAWGGIASVSVALRAMWTTMHSRGFSLSDVACLMAQKPAELAGLQGRKGQIAEGYDADFVVFDPDHESVVRAEQLHTRHPLSPYIGERLRGTVVATWLRGKKIFADGSFPGEARGQEVRTEPGKIL
jgi:allantoinase